MSWRRRDAERVMDFRFPEDRRFPAWKVALFQYSILVTLLVIAAGYWRLQVGGHRHYAQLAERNRIRNLPIIAPRGRILDREGRVIVDNFPGFSILLSRDSGTSLLAKVDGLARGFKLDPQEVRQWLERSAKLPRFQPVVLKQDATLEDLAFLESHRLEYPELDKIERPRRLYVHKELAAHLVGYVGEVSEEMLAQPGSPYRSGDVVGKSGVERSYDHLLAGRDGMRRVVVDSRGREVGMLSQINASPGSDLRLTVDMDLQQVAEQALADQNGAVVALDPRTGEVLALVSRPAFDPNAFAVRIARETWENLIKDEGKPLINKAIQAHLAPGSVFKIMTAVAGLESGVIEPQFNIFCHGALTVYGRTFNDWIKRGHGWVDLHRAIVHSCDVFFYTLGKLLGIERIAFFATHLGLGAPTGIDLPGEDAGLIPSPEWVGRRFKRRWWPGETISVATGQGAVAVTPIQLAHTLGGIASGGVFRRPHVAFWEDLRALGQNPQQEDVRRFPLQETTVEAICRGMWGVVNEGGTGASARLPGLDVAGKTGTAQVVGAETRKAAGRNKFRNNAWFIGYAPSRNPEIVVSVLLLGGEHSHFAAPPARDVIRAYYEKKERRTPAKQETFVKLMSQTDPHTATAGLLGR